ncbi:MAG: nucleoside monophosphate kinase [Candidatus Levybacteria bacterium]|nr:nucleoside monophosphate kinase [Candidatus Levybacteria bacterium]MBP9814879.1 nucleoside monophosphate kinase [Candidatus Levybacteria bacterium]
MQNIYILIGPPLSGKETQGELLETSLGGIPRFSMGHLIREARNKDKKFEDAYQEYSMRGKHLPNNIKFPLLADKMNKASRSGFILDNFPASAEDVEYLEKYLVGKELNIKTVIVLNISEDEMRKRFEIARNRRGRADDTIENIRDRREIQDADRIAVLNHYKNLGIVKVINGEQSVEMVHQDILKEVDRS